jgi:hypothetical protein
MVERRVEVGYSIATGLYNHHFAQLCALSIEGMSGGVDGANSSL